MGTFTAGEFFGTVDEELHKVTSDGEDGGGGGQRRLFVILMTHGRIILRTEIFIMYGIPRSEML